MLSPVRRLSIIFLSLVLTYAGVAWAFETCLGRDHHSDHGTAEHRSDSQALVGHYHSQNPSVPVIHCTPFTQQVGPAARMASAEIPRSGECVALDMVSFPYTASAVLRNDLWLEAVFKRFVTVSLPRNFARHLSLSVLQI